MSLPVFDTLAFFDLSKPTRAAFLAFLAALALAAPIPRKLGAADTLALLGGGTAAAVSEDSRFGEGVTDALSAVVS
jgi:hypothetical protein